MLSALKAIGIVIAVAVAFFFGVVGTVFLSLRSSEVKVPDIVGKDRYAAENELKDANLRFRVRASRPSNQAKPDTVMFQLPRACEVVKSGQTVAVDISRPAQEGEAGENMPESNTNSASGTNSNANSAAANLNANKPPRNRNRNDNANANTNGNVNNANGNRNVNRVNANSNDNRRVNTNANAGNGNANRNGANANRSNTNTRNTNVNANPNPTPTPNPASTNRNRVVHGNTNNPIP